MKKEITLDLKLLITSELEPKEDVNKLSIDLISKILSQDISDSNFMINILEIKENNSSNDELNSIQSDTF
ncbi:MAG: hypothetical protein IPP08_05230 [Chlorobiota bacterium]|nr:hypothetical protein [Chlorobiota bacterium]QQS67568.1 MAG: hypothetical protein IPP08_05230 [Chlorobiota bacterium]